MDTTEETRARFSAPIPGFGKRLRAAVAHKYPSISACGIALGVPHSTLMTWIGGQNTPKHADDLVALSEGLDVALDQLVFGRMLSVRDWHEQTRGRRLERAAIEHFGDLRTYRQRLGVTANMTRRWFRGEQRPDLFYLRHTCAMVDLSMDWWARGVSWEITEARTQWSTAHRASVLAVRTLERMAAREVDPGMAWALRQCAKRAGRLPVTVAPETQETLPGLD